jgi:plastocyanin
MATRPRFGRLVAALAVLVLVLAACSKSTSGGGSTSSPPGGGGGGGGGTSITISNFAFHPNALTLPPGKVTLSVTNNDSTLHSFTLDNGSVSQDIQPGTTAQVTITVPSSGTLGWHCRIHPTMTGTITVG